MKRFERRHAWIGGAALAASLVLAMPAGADVVTFQNGVDGYEGTDDTHFYSGTLAAKNSGASVSYLIGVTANGTSERRAIFRFDVSALAGQYSSIQSARLELTGTGHGGYPDFTLSLYQIADANAGWVEGNGNFTNAADGEPAWRSRADGPTVAARIPWAGSPGLRTAGTDYLAPALDTVTYRESDVNGTVYSFDLTPALIEQWVTGVNAGVLLFRDDLSFEGQGQFHSSENTTNAAYAPRLVIEYTPVPEPATAALLVLGGAVMLCRKARRER